jgi:hypothetical protein
LGDFITDNQIFELIELVIVWVFKRFGNDLEFSNVSFSDESAKYCSFEFYNTSDSKQHIFYFNICTWNIEIMHVIDNEFDKKMYLSLTSQIVKNNAPSFYKRK